MKTMRYKVVKTRAGNHCLYISDAFQKTFLPSGVQLRQDVIQKKNRLLPDSFLYKFNLRKLQRERRRPLLPLASELTHIDIIDKKQKIISVRTG